VDFSVLIPTYDRPADLSTCVDSIAMQSAPPMQCIVVDDGALSNFELDRVRRKLAGVELTYYRKNHASERRGLSESKNIGLTLATADIVFILDDDIVLEPEFFSSIMEVWSTLDSERLMGVGGTITNLRARSGLEKLYNAVFLLDSQSSWDVTPVGFQVWDEEIRARDRGYYVHGGLSSVRKSRALQFPFNTFRGGRTALEDVDFCMRAKSAGYFFYMEPRARALHNTSPVSREGMYLYGIKESANRREIFRNNASPTARLRLRFAWCSIGWVLKQVLAGNFHKAAGMIVGLFGR
jgi:glucosyl-dolichyl phosphate glucuronosyltransferase